MILLCCDPNLPPASSPKYNTRLLGIYTYNGFEKLVLDTSASESMHGEYGNWDFHSLLTIRQHVVNLFAVGAIGNNLDPDCSIIWDDGTSIIPKKAPPAPRPLKGVHRCKCRYRISTGFPANVDGNVENISIYHGKKTQKNQNHMLKNAESYVDIYIHTYTHTHTHTHTHKKDHFSSKFTRKSAKN